MSLTTRGRRGLLVMGVVLALLGLVLTTGDPWQYRSLAYFVDTPNNSWWFPAVPDGGTVLASLLLLGGLAVLTVWSYVVLPWWGLLVLGAAFLIGGEALTGLRIPSFGWTAYAPLSNSTYVPSVLESGPHIGGELLILAAVSLLVMGVVRVLFRRARLG